MSAPLSLLSLLNKKLYSLLKKKFHSLLKTHPATRIMGRPAKLSTRQLVNL